MSNTVSSSRSTSIRRDPSFRACLWHDIRILLNRFSLPGWSDAHISFPMARLFSLSSSSLLSLLFPHLWICMMLVSYLFPFILYFPFPSIVTCPLPHLYMSMNHTYAFTAYLLQRCWVIFFFFCGMKSFPEVTFNHRGMTRLIILLHRWSIR